MRTLPYHCIALDMSEDMLMRLTLFTKMPSRRPCGDPGLHALAANQPCHKAAWRRAQIGGFAKR